MTGRLLFVDQSGALGGAELSLLDIAERYTSSGCHVVLLSDGPFRTALERAGVAVTVLPLPDAAAGVRREAGLRQMTRAVPGLLGAIRRLARQAEPFNLIYANTQKALVVAVAAGLRTGKPVVWHLRDILSAEHFSRTNRRLSVFLANHGTKRVLVNSRATGEAFVAAGGDRRLIGVVPNGIDPAPFDAVDDAELARLRLEFPLGDTPLLGLFGRLAPWKGQHVLIEALGRIPGAHALLVGDPLFGNEPYARTLIGLAQAHGVADRVHFLGFRHDVPALMRFVSIVIHTSTSPEPFGRVLVEGMLAERPVIATAGGGTSEIIEHGVSGLLLPPGDPAALAEAVLGLLGDPARAGALAAAGRREALRRFSVEAMIGAIRRELAQVRIPGHPG